VLMLYRRTPAANALLQPLKHTTSVCAAFADRKNVCKAVGDAEECHRTQHTHAHYASHKHAEPLPSSHHFAIAIPAHTGAASTAAVKLQRKLHAPMCMSKHAAVKYVHS
jgi:hypothetical protein